MSSCPQALVAVILDKCPAEDGWVTPVALFYLFVRIFLLFPSRPWPRDLQERSQGREDRPGWATGARKPRPAPRGSDSERKPDAVRPLEGSRDQLVAGVCLGTDLIDITANVQATKPTNQKLLPQRSHQQTEKQPLRWEQTSGTERLQERTSQSVWKRPQPSPKVRANDRLRS